MKKKDFVKCNYKGVGWKGIIIDFEVKKYKSKKYKICKIVILYDNKGIEQDNLIIKSYSEYYLEKIEKIELTEKQKKWLIQIDKNNKK